MNNDSNIRKKEPEGTGEIPGSDRAAGECEGKSTCTLTLHFPLKVKIVGLSDLSVCPVPL